MQTPGSQKGAASPGLAATAAGSTGAVGARSASPAFVLVHGAWHGGWCWARVAANLRAAGHSVFTPTQTGLAERMHLLSKAITLETFIADIANTIEAWELSDLILVGHSFGGLAISGVADSMPHRIRRLVYLDALIVEGGQSPLNVLSPEVAATRTKLAHETSGGVSLPAPSPSAFGVVDEEDAAWLRRRLTPHPFGTYTSPLPIKGPPGNNLPRSYIACTNPVYQPLEAVRQWVKAQPGWNWRELEAAHDAMVTAPGELTRLLLEEAAQEISLQPTQGTNLLPG
jgi:pimeloyl-ACP methyl ester carboxylesterase